MTISGIICEYNPFHNGHKFQIEKARKDGADYIVAIMSGNFTQRGEATIVDKYVRTEMALKNGIDLVIELPVIFATGDAGIFARGGVEILNSLGVIDNLCFGTEEGSIDFCHKLVSFFKEPPKAYTKELNTLLKSGFNFPTARSIALQPYFSEIQLAMLKGSNMILGIEYCQALQELNSKITPFPIERKGANYNDTNIDSSGFSSASAIRNLLSNNTICAEALLKNMPQNCVEILQKSPFVFPKDFSYVLHHKLIINDDFCKYLDITEAFSKRISLNKYSYSDYDSFCQLLKSKNITHASVQRLLSHILLELSNNTPRNINYARILGFKKGSLELLSLIKKHSKIPLVTKLADFPDNDCLKADIISSHIYEALKSDKYNLEFQNEYSRQLVIVD